MFILKDLNDTSCEVCNNDTIVKVISLVCFLDRSLFYLIQPETEYAALKSIYHSLDVTKSAILKHYF